MEEKERYEIHIYDDVCVALYDNGVLNKSINDTYKLEKLLNKQNKHIKELEEENKELKDFTENTANLIDKLTEDSVFASTQLAIEELERLKEYIIEGLADKIKELKGEKIC